MQKSLVFQRWINDEIALRKNRLTKYADSNYKMNKICSNEWQRQHSQDHLFCWLAISFLLMHNKSYDCVHQQQQQHQHRHTISVDYYFVLKMFTFNTIAHYLLAKLIHFLKAYPKYSIVFATPSPIQSIWMQNRNSHSFNVKFKFWNIWFAICKHLVNI